MAFATAAAIGAGSQLAGGLLARKKSKKGPAPIMAQDTITPRFSLSQGVEGGRVTSRLARFETPESREREARFGRQLSDIDTARGALAPGFSQFRQAGIQTLQDQAQASKGTLREQLRRRRVAGSSFGADAQTRVDATFAREQAQFEAQTFVQELQSAAQLRAEEFGLLSTQIENEFRELGIAAGVSGQFSAMASSNQQFMQQLSAQAAQGTGEFIGQLGERTGNIFAPQPQSIVEQMMAAGLLGGGGTGAS